MVPHAKRQSRQSIRPTTSRLAVILMAAAFALPAAAQDRPRSEWITLGTRSGPVPLPTNSQPANLLHYANQFILVDADDGTLDQLAKAKIPLGAVRTVFISRVPQVRVCFWTLTWDEMEPQTKRAAVRRPILQ